MASPLGLSRPVDKTLEDKILWGEYIDFALLLPDTLYQSQTPEIQLRLDDSFSGPTENLAAPGLCASTSTSPLAAGAEIAATPTCAAAAIPAPTPPRNAPSHSPAAPTRPQDRATAARSKVEQQRHNHMPLVSAPINIYHLELELATHPDRTFVYNLLNPELSLQKGAYPTEDLFCGTRFPQRLEMCLV
ncbi:unnamed protein product [Porites evermanni]|uniref:Uncharacterized protein n=1 Tax=Porites evermanni TaxID=104178 RepID=A0ABN8SDU0_9CNID|nr:unnamed protein product [Porites evermanni]